MYQGKLKLDRVACGDAFLAACPLTFKTVARTNVRRPQAENYFSLPARLSEMSLFFKSIIFL